MLTDCQLEAGDGWQLMKPVNDDCGMVWELCAPGGGPVCGLLLLRWENGPLATLLLADAGA